MHVDHSRKTVQQWLAEWMELRRDRLSPTTLHRDQGFIDRDVLPAIGGIHLQDLKTGHLDTLYADLRAGRRSKRPDKPLSKKPLSKSTVAKLHRILHKALKDAVRKQLVVTNVADFADPPRPGRSTAAREDAWSIDEAQAFLKGSVDHPMFSAFWLALFTGMRLGEVAGLRWNLVRLEDDQPSLIVADTRVDAGGTVEKPPKTGHTRKVDLDPATTEVMKAHKMAAHEWRTVNLEMPWADEDRHVFENAAGVPIRPDSLSQAFSREVRRLGIRHIPLKGLRHTHITWAIEAGGNPKAVADRVGHANPTMTMNVYSHVSPGVDAALAAAVADKFTSA